MRFSLVVAFAAANLLAACGSPEALDLSAAKARWNQQALTNYHFDYVRSCECTLGGEVLVVTVKNGAISEAKRKTSGAALTTDEVASLPTVASLFERLEKASREAEVWKATYDAEKGYPLTVSIDWKKSVADDEASETLSNLASN